MYLTGTSHMVVLNGIIFSSNKLDDNSFIFENSMKYRSVRKPELVDTYSFFVCVTPPENNKGY